MAAAAAVLGCGEGDGDSTTASAPCNKSPATAVELAYSAYALPSTKLTPASLDRTVDIVCQRLDTLSVDRAGVAAVSRPDGITVSLPEEPSERISTAITSSGNLGFYDWEPNVVGEPGAANPGERPLANLYDAVRLAAKQKPECKGCTQPARYYSFDRKSNEPLGDPAYSKGDLEASAAGAGEILEVPEGTLVVNDEQAGGWFVLRDRPAVSGADVTSAAVGEPLPGGDADTSAEAPLDLELTPEAAAEFKRLTRGIAQRAGHFAVVLDGKLVSLPSIDSGTSPNGIDATAGVQIAGGFTPEELQDTANILRIGPLPVALGKSGRSG